MALVFMDSFDHYAIDDMGKKWDKVNGWQLDIAYVSQRRSGTKYFSCPEGAVDKDVVDTVTGEAILTCIVGCAMRYDTNCPGIVIRLGGETQLCNIGVDTSNGRIYISLGPHTYYYTNPDEVSPNTWFHLEAKLVLHQSAGSYEVRLNEIPVLSDSGIDTMYYDNGIRTIRLEGGLRLWGSAYFDDFFFLDGNESGDPANPNNDFLGDCRIDCIYPNDPGTYTDFTPYPSAPNYQNVDDGTVAGGGDIDDDDTYNESATVGHKDCYNLDSVIALGTPIYAAAQNTCVRKTDAGRRYITQFVISGGSEYPRDEEYHLTDNYKVIQRPLDLDPDTDLAWTESGLNSLESGIELTT